ncbi:MAG: MoxR family ATPase [Deltaproteobacteria bacterium]|nr:MoxR family ATPase [Deltaproteobacteria bacterium]
MKGGEPALERSNRARCILDKVNSVVLGAEDAAELCLIALLSGGHALVEDVPGVGKTTLARSLAVAVGADFKRIQFTSDLLPADIVGISVFDRRTGAFEFKPGPVFTSVLLADEINRATPRTQSALLEAMNDGKVTVDGETRRLPSPFFVIATQNPLEHYGTYPLPESQMDRFLIRTAIGYPGRDFENDLLVGKDRADILEDLDPAVSIDELLELQGVARAVHVSDEVLHYILDIVEATRNSKFLEAGISPRGALLMHKAVKVKAMLSNRKYALPDDVQELAVPVFAHRITLKGFRETLLQARQEAEAVIKDIVSRVPVRL